MIPTIKLYIPVVKDHSGEFELELPGLYPYRQALAIALEEKRTTPSIGSITLRRRDLTATDVARMLNNR